MSAVAPSPLGPFRCVQEDVIPHAKGFVGNPQVFRAADGTLLLAVIGTSCALYSAGSVDGPWACANVSAYNNPTLAPMADGSVALFYHNVGFWGSAVSGVLGATRRGPWAEHGPGHDPPAPADDATRLGQLFAHPCEDPFVWFDATNKRFRMVTHTFRM